MDCHVEAKPSYSSGLLDNKHCETAIRLDPRLAAGFRMLARCRMLSGDYRDALRHAQTAEHLDGASRRVYVASATVALCAGEYGTCLEKCHLAHELSPLADDPQLLYLQGLARHFAADYSGAVADLQRAATISRIPSVLVGLAVVLKQQEREPELVEELITELHALASMAGATPYDFAELHAGAGELPAAMDYLRRGLALHLPEMIGVGSDPLFRPLRTAPEFATILEALGLSAAAAKPKI